MTDYVVFNKNWMKYNRYFKQEEYVRLNRNVWL